MSSKRSGTKAKSVGEAKRGKSKAKQGLKDLDVRKGKQVRAGLSCATGLHYKEGILTVRK